MVNYINLICSNCKKKSLSFFFVFIFNDVNKELIKEVNWWCVICKVINKVINQNEFVEDVNIDKFVIVDLEEVDKVIDRIYRNFVIMLRLGDNVVL